MFRHCGKCSLYICSAVVAPSTIKSHYADSSEKTKETGWDRVAKIFTVNEFGDYTPELSHIYQATLFTTFFGACYGGFIQSRNAYHDFIERNEATKFRTHFEAKRELQNYVTVNFAKGAFKWSWRVGLFGAMYITYVTCAATYRGDPSIFDFVAGGLLSGTVYRVNYGLRGIIVGGTLGSLIGLLAGALTMNVLRFTGNKFDDIYEWQMEQDLERKRHIRGATEKALFEDHHRKMSEEHDKRITAV